MILSKTFDLWRKYLIYHCVEWAYLYKQTKDEDFDKEETKFREIEKTVKIFAKDVETYMDQLQVCFNNSPPPTYDL